MSDENTDRRFGPYRILGVLGSGGMGEVLRAHDDEHGRVVALKVLHPQWATDEEFRERFRREARIAARLNEPHVVPIHRYGEIDGQLFLDMRLVEGEDLAAVLRRAGRLAPARAVDVVGQVARALDAAHADGLVHRDVKPSNVLLVARADGQDLATSAAGEDFCYLADFGIARASDDLTGPALTGTGKAIGSTEYMAPERFAPGAPDGRADVYSLACVLFELLTGRRAFLGGDPVALMAAHLHQPPPPPSALVPGIPQALDEVVLRGLAKDPDQRWTTAGAMASAARAALARSGVPVPSEAPTTVGPAAAEDAGGREVTRRQDGAADPPTAALPGGMPTAGASAAPVPPTSSEPRPARRRLPWVVAAAALALAVAAAVLVAITAVGASRTAEAATEAGQRLLDTTLADGQDAEGCTAREVGDGVLRQLTCPGDPEEAPTVIGYTAHEGGGAAAAIDDDIAANDLGRLDDRFDCGQTVDDGGPGPEGWLPVVDDEDVEVGRMACWVDGDGDAVLSWAWDDLGTLGVAEQRGGGARGLSELRSWWDSTADRGFN